MTDALAFLVGLVILFVCVIEWNEPEPPSHPDNLPSFVITEGG